MRDFTIDGYVTKNIETRSTQSGQLVTRFTVNSPNYNRETRQSTPQFFDCEYWHNGQQDDKALNIVEGALLLLWGSLAYDSWQDKQTGQNRSKAYLKVREIGVIRPPQPRQAPQPQGYQQPAYAPQQYQQGYRQSAPQQAAPAPRYGSQQVAQAPAPAPQQYQQQAAPQAAQQPPVIDVYDEDIPF
ncbi:single-stranded DNA-binding protein [Olsenella sp. An188]|uniref:single-stranded DNA-binding protein n=1 Tax=Olsenella sp. An188 TaxID=1965579 RepID=UPI0013024CDC|nr:single-stranded DNA-binding protein [Olsenella sp. An188]